ncbi:hypothetical protein QRO11_16115 [Paracidovorax citrulli]|nr:hypothetical protein [Paracidovorax citrulli]ATG94868.1 hypothetical protein CQB05_13180 [Paracidovorax citrulli]PVY66297.1 hypothetical protein C8E08_3700 [Paracidovorax citrulli]QCX12033.1 hypothetical protein APS58_3261 [Paracidovorax citrulli]REG69531.1 hypothetical protein C8E07_2687 [Paracidovorax citrulli]RLJ94085.1 hypothetical protein C8E06_2686 [Paracidovorax citrulli]
MPGNPHLAGLAPRAARRASAADPAPPAGPGLAGLHTLQPGPAELSPAELGEKIGSGSQKDVYRLRSRPGACVALVRREAIGHFDTPLSHAQREVAALLELKARGFRTVAVYSLVRVGRLVGIEQAYLPAAKNSADIVASGGAVPSERYLTTLTVDDCDTNIATLRHTRTVVDDLQFLVEESGALHITDPPAVCTGDPDKSVGTVKELRGLALSATLSSDDDSA